MPRVRKHPVRVIFRLSWFLGELALAGLRFLNRRHSRQRLRNFRSLWLHTASRRVLKVLNVSLQTSGPIPSTGFLVSNHLSYLDILVLSALTPAVFIAKSDLKKWPLFGWFAHMAGTVFVNRRSRCDVKRVNEQSTQALAAGDLIVLFPEGTSTDGTDILPFKSSLLEPVTGCKHPITLACIKYNLVHGDPRAEVCYWGNMTLVPHVINLMGHERISVQVIFEPVGNSTACRKILAENLHSNALRIKEAKNHSSFENTHHGRPKLRTHR